MRAAIRDSRLGPFVNLVTNPAMVATSGTVEVRRNLSPQPVPTVNTGFTIAGGSIGFTDGFAGMSSAVRHTRDGASAARLAQIIGPALVVQESFALVLQVRASEPLSGVKVYWRGRTHDASGQRHLGDYNLPAGESEIRVSGLAPSNAGGTDSGWALLWSSGTVGSTLDVTGIQVETGTAAGPLIAAGVPYPDPDLTASWEGAENGSPSVLTALQVADVPLSTVPNMVAYSTQDAPVRGERALRYSLPEGEAFILPVSNVTASTDQPVTVSVRVRARATTSAALIAYSTPDLSELVPLPAGEWVELRRYAPNPVLTAPLFSGIIVTDDEGNIMPPNVIDIDSAMNVEGEYDGPYFDGDSPRCVWQGVPHQSPSIGYPTLS